MLLDGASSPAGPIALTITLVLVLVLVLVVVCAITESLLAYTSTVMWARPQLEERTRGIESAKSTMRMAIMMQLSKGPAGCVQQSDQPGGTFDMKESTGQVRCSVLGARVPRHGSQPTVSKCWCNQMFTTRNVDVPLTAGPHTIVLEYDEALGQAEVSLSWQ